MAGFRLKASIRSLNFLVYAIIAGLCFSLIFFISSGLPATKFSLANSTCDPDTVFVKPYQKKSKYSKHRSKWIHIFVWKIIVQTNLHILQVNCRGNNNRHIFEDPALWNSCHWVPTRWMSSLQDHLPLNIYVWRVQRPSHNYGALPSGAFDLKFKRQKIIHSLRPWIRTLPAQSPI